MTLSPSTITVSELQQRLAQADNMTLVDVREDNELAVCALPGALHIPLNQIPARTGEIPTDQPVVIFCHHGGRSSRAFDYLRQHGFENVINLTGGIHAWATQIDPSMPTY